MFITVFIDTPLDIKQSYKKYKYKDNINSVPNY